VLRNRPQSRLFKAVRIFARNRKTGLNHKNPVFVFSRFLFLQVAVLACGFSAASAESKSKGPDSVPLTKPETGEAKSAVELVREADQLVKGRELEARVKRPEQEILKEWIQEAEAKGDFQKAEAYYLKILSYVVPTDQKRDALVAVGKLEEEKLQQLVKAAAVYEQVLTLWPGDPEGPELNLRMGRIYRELGTPKLSLNKFYNVLYSALRVGEGQDYKGMTLRAQLEIAKTHLIAGEWEEAGKYYERLKKLELPVEDRSEVHFRAAQTLQMAKEHVKSVAAAREFLANFPGSPYAPECQYSMIQSLKALKRSEEALAETVRLLRTEKERARKHPELWAYWQQKTGNELGNELYASGDSLHALTVYQTLAEINDSPEWRLPAVYQIGLCFERLKHPERALEAYRYISDFTEPKSEKSSKEGVASEKSQKQVGLPDLGFNLGTIREMAKWRYDHLQWIQRTEGKVNPLIGKKPAVELPEVSFLARPGLRSEKKAAGN
jgi:tetratricopeptide (TPR) repeat protein